LDDDTRRYVIIVFDAYTVSEEKTAENLQRSYSDIKNTGKFTSIN